MKFWRRLQDLFEIHLRKNVKLVDRLLRADLSAESLCRGREDLFHRREPPF
jgi:hypothetical protein